MTHENSVVHVPVNLYCLKMDKDIITIRVTDSKTGLIEYEYIRTYELGLRFRTERECLHRALDDFIDKVRHSKDGERRFALEFINRDPYKETELQF